VLDQDHAVLFGRHCHIAEEEHKNLYASDIFYPTATASRHTFIAAVRKARCVLADIKWRWTLKILWGAARTKVLVAWQQSTERSMSQANNLRGCHTTFDQHTSLIAVVEMSQSSWLVAAVAGDRQRDF
jgi:hypothetical protein